MPAIRQVKFISAFFIVFYREGLSPLLLLAGMYMVTISVLTLLVPHIYLIIGTLSWALILIGLVRRTLKKIMLVVLVTLGTLVLIEGFNLFVEKMLKPHQQNRIKALFDPNVDPLGIGWNVTQSKIAIGSGGLWGKGFLAGSQTKYGFVPEQSTDFIFCTIGEEHGWIGALLVIGIFLGMISRILYIAERQRLRFARVYGYAVASILFFHFMINIGMTIGIMPVIGIPLPFISYGGSSLWSFSIMLFVLLKFDAERRNYHSWQQVTSLD
jgi:rod shape determining protein RodA